MPSVPLKLVLILTTLAFIGMVLGAFLPTTFVAQDTAGALIDDLGTRISKGIVHDIDGVTTMFIAMLESTVSSLNEVPDSPAALRLLLRLILTARVVDYIHMVSADGRTYYGLKLGDQGEDWQFNVLNSSLSCRTDYNLTVDPVSRTAAVGKVLRRFCGYNPLREFWMDTVLNSTSTTVTTAAPRFGLPVPPSSLTFSSPFWDDAGNVLGYIGVAYSLDDITRVLHRLQMDGNSGAVLLDARNGQYLAGSWIDGSHLHTPLYNLSEYVMTDIRPKAKYVYLSPTSNQIGDPLKSEHLNFCVTNPLGFAMLNSSSAVYATFDEEGERLESDTVYHVVDPESSIAKIQCRVTDIVDTRIPTLHLRVLVFIEEEHYTHDLNEQQKTIGIIIGVFFAVILALQLGLVYEMTHSINRMGELVHETITKKRRRGKGKPSMGPDAEGAESEDTGNAIATLAHPEADDSTSRRSYITEISDMQEKLAHFGESMNQFVPTEVVAELILSGRPANVCVTPTSAVILFVDIESFTTMCETVDAQELSEILAIYYEKQCETVAEHGGVVDKFIGDCVMALWDAPRSVDCSEVRAVCASLHLRDNMNRKQTKEALAELGVGIKVRVGVAKGTVLAGCMGSTSRLAYTALGDPVNLAARLEGANKKFGTRILINEAVMLGLLASSSESLTPVAPEATIDFICRDLGTVQVVGKNIAERVFQVMGVRGNSTTTHVGGPLQSTSQKMLLSLQAAAKAGGPLGTTSKGLDSKSSNNRLKVSRTNSYVTDSVDKGSNHSNRSGRTSGRQENHTQVSMGTSQLSAKALALFEEIRLQSDQVVLSVPQLIRIAKATFPISEAVQVAVEHFNRGTSLLLQDCPDEAAAEFVQAAGTFGAEDRLCALMLSKLSQPQQELQQQSGRSVPREVGVFPASPLARNNLVPGLSMAAVDEGVISFRAGFSALEDSASSLAVSEKDRTIPFVPPSAATTTSSDFCGNQHSRALFSMDSK